MVSARYRATGHAVTGRFPDVAKVAASLALSGFSGSQPLIFRLVQANANFLHSVMNPTTSSRNVKLCCLILACLSLMLKFKAAGAAACHDPKRLPEAGHSAIAAQTIHKVAGCHNLPC